MKRKKLSLPLIVLLVIALTVGYLIKTNLPTQQPSYSQSVMEVPAFSADPFVVLKDNQPEFDQDDHTTKAYEYYSELDALGRCGYAMACIGRELMPTQDRESISSVKPSGWVQAQYGIVDGESLYNRCHLIGFQLTGENANERNLITGTRYMNVEGMLPFENMVADYIKETGYHVLYRVTPVYDGDALVARGVQMEALSMEDSGAGICFNVYVYNEQPGIAIDHTDGTSRLVGLPEPTQGQSDTLTYVLNLSSMKFHEAGCAQSDGIRTENREESTLDRQSLIDMGYAPAGCCKP